MKNHHHSPHLVIRDVTLRDGLQNLPGVISTADKLDLLDALIDAGVKEFQITSFVSAARVPQMNDAEAVYAGSVKRGLSPNVLVVILKGFDRAVSAGVKSIDAVLSASNTHNRRNANRTTLESANEIITMLSRAAHAGARVGVNIANSFHCASEGAIDPEMILALMRGFHDSGVRFVCLSDTTGQAKADAVAHLVDKCLHMGVDVGLHLRDTHGRAGENARAGYKAGARCFDAALSGLGGSPFTPGVGGNLSLETADAVFAEAGVATGLVASKLATAREKMAGITAAAAKAGAA